MTLESFSQPSQSLPHTTSYMSRLRSENDHLSQAKQQRMYPTSNMDPK